MICYKCEDLATEEITFESGRKIKVCGCCADEICENPMNRVLKREPITN